MKVQVRWLSGDVLHVEPSTPTVFEVKQAICALHGFTCADLVVLAGDTVGDCLGNECEPPAEVRVVVNTRDDLTAHEWCQEMRRHASVNMVACTENVRKRMEAHELHSAISGLLCDAIVEKANDILVTCLDAQCAIDGQNELGFTALMTACRWNRGDAFTTLMKRDANVLLKNDLGWGALFYAMQFSTAVVVADLILASADCQIEERNVAGLTPLCAAAQDRDDTMALRLLTLQADVNARDTEGDTPLMHAARVGGSLEQLFTHKADVSLQNDEGCTALHAAAHRGHDGVVIQLLAAMANVDETNDVGDTALMLAASCSVGADCVSVLLESLADLSLKDEYGQTPLHVAAEAGHVDAVSRLLVGRADVNNEDDYGYTPLIRASQGGFDDVAVMLLDRGADVNQQTSGGQTALIETAREGCVELVNMLLHRGADVNIQSNIGYSALMVGAIKGHEGVVEALLDYHASTEAVDDRGRTALDHARNSGLHDIVNLLPSKRRRSDSHDS
eukprot:GEMP01033298.1.p1 GENE.GEMP01033298.1~~GEMP01033298.1.p1  ORF type:complete len:505 (+),score=135.76 GEMP01033298.1:85-1599(+)